MSVTARVQKAIKRRLGKLKSQAQQRVQTKIAKGDPAWQPRTPAFAVGTGRCGTHFLWRVIGSDAAIDSHHTDHADADSFARYCIWNELPIDMEAYLQDYQQRIDEATSQNRIYFEANPYLSFSIWLLYARFGGKFIFIVRNPAGTVNSHIDKGWYETPPIVGNPDLAVGFQPGLLTSLTFGRIVPRGAEYHRWARLTRVGKLAWMWNTVNQRIHDQFQQLPETHRIFVKLEDLDYDKYVHLHTFVGGGNPMPSDAYQALVQNPPGKGPRKHSSDAWSQTEREEFLCETAPMREILRYE